MEETNLIKAVNLPIILLEYVQKLKWAKYHEK